MVTGIKFNSIIHSAVPLYYFPIRFQYGILSLWQKDGMLGGGVGEVTMLLYKKERKKKK